MGYGRKGERKNSSCGGKLNGMDSLDDNSNSFELASGPGDWEWEVSSSRSKWDGLSRDRSDRWSKELSFIPIGGNIQSIQQESS